MLDIVTILPAIILRLSCYVSSAYAHILAKYDHGRGIMVALCSYDWKKHSHVDVIGSFWKQKPKIKSSQTNIP